MTEQISKLIKAIGSFIGLLFAFGIIAIIVSPIIIMVARFIAIEAKFFYNLF